MEKVEGSIKVQTLTEYGWWWTSGYDVLEPTVEGAIEWCKQQQARVTNPRRYRVVVVPWTSDLDDSRLTPREWVKWEG